METKERLYNCFSKCLSAKYLHVENDGSYCLIKNDNTLIIYFEKSNGNMDWKSNFNFPAKPYRKMQNKWYCHRGFLKVWKSIEPYVADDINDSNISKIEIVGYSHGGAIIQE